MIKEFNKIEKHIKTDEGLKLFRDFREKLIQSEKYTNKLDSYFMDTIDGVTPERAKILNNL